VIKTVVFVPEQDKEGRDFPRSQWLELEERFRRFGGFTRGTNVEGEWEDQCWLC
jgi:hypothetical protein